MLSLWHDVVFCIKKKYILVNDISNCVMSFLILASVALSWKYWDKVMCFQPMVKGIMTFKMLKIWPCWFKNRWGVDQFLPLVIFLVGPCQSFQKQYQCLNNTMVCFLRIVFDCDKFTNEKHDPKDQARVNDASTVSVKK